VFLKKKQQTEPEADQLALVSSGSLLAVSQGTSTSSQNSNESSSTAVGKGGQPKRLHVSNIPFRFRDPDLRAMFGVRILIEYSEVSWRARDSSLEPCKWGKIDFFFTQNELEIQKIEIPTFKSVSLVQNKLA